MPYGDLRPGEDQTGFLVWSVILDLDLDLDLGVVVGWL